MNELPWFIALLLVGVPLACNSDIVCTDRLAMLDYKCVYIEPLKSENPQVGEVLRDVLEKELIRRNVEVCDPNSATIFVSGATFLTERSTSDKNFLGGSSTSSQAIESISLVAKDCIGQVLVSASYDNQERHSASRLAKDFGSALAEKLR
ncbi:MAG: hypothetical protein ACYTE5_07715 [Planctomycetota bacterium]|jgi:hypothetical protein